MIQNTPLTKSASIAYRRVITLKRYLKPGTYAEYINKYRKLTPDKISRTRNSPTDNLEKHHILPKHAGGTNDSSNLILLPVRSHILAHLLRFLEFGEIPDFNAYLWRRYTEKFDLTSHGKKMAARNKMLGKSFWNSDVQRELGQRGGAKGGSANTEAQFIARQKVGNTYGRKVGISKQKAALKATLTNFLIFERCTDPSIQVIVPPCLAVIDVARELNCILELRKLDNLKLNLNAVKKGGPFYGLLKSTKPSAYGWRLIDIDPLKSEE